MSDTQRKDLDPKELRVLLEYNAETGRLLWRERDVSYFTDGTYSKEWSCRRWNTRYAGKPALASMDGQGYLDGCIFRQRYLAHRVAWAIHFGEWPKQQIDHINGNPRDNRIENLRDVSNVENSKNLKMCSRNTSGYNGVSWNAREKRWQVQGRVNAKSVNLGQYVKFEDAVAARKAFDAKHGYSKRHGKARTALAAIREEQ